MGCRHRWENLQAMLKSDIQPFMIRPSGRSARLNSRKSLKMTWTMYLGASGSLKLSEKRPMEVENKKMVIARENKRGL